MHAQLQGCHVALPTPFRDGRVDLEALEDMIERLAQSPIDGVLIAGTTGEVPTLNDYEHRSVIHAAVEANRGRLHLMAGVGTNCTRASIELARFAATAGADSLLAVTPYYNRPNRRGLLLHYGLLADASDLPLVLYNVPKRTAVDLLPETAAELERRHPTIVAIKEASGSTPRVRELAQTTTLAVLGGDDATLAEACEAGAVGAVSVVANLLPGVVVELLELASLGDHAAAAAVQQGLAPLLEALAQDVNPVPIKVALASLKLCGEEVRPPLAPMTAAARAHLLDVLATLPADGVAHHP
ncbi:MAG: 4-hydroxy-tetrahydrodipicolinate synthase [Planctomycetes bacterium]|nr:4-hydroxy-tetrahydrodipicolinate synthase [Planctomycetota bacterium]